MDGCAVQLRTPAIFCADMRRVDPSPPRLTAGPVGIHLRSIAVPMALGFVALNSYSIADTYFVGQLGTLPLAAMSFTFPVAFAMISVGLGVGIGTSSVVARLLGTGDRAAVQRITTHALILGAVAGLLLLAVGLATIEPVFRLLGADERTLPLITEYMQVYYLGSMFFILPMVGNHAIRATGDAMVPAVILSLSAVLNVVLDPILIFGWLGFPRLELRGAAIATVIANTVTVLASLTVLYRRERLILPRYLSVAGLSDSWRRLLHVSVPATGANLLIPITMAVITALVAGFGPEAVAGFGVASRVESVVLIVVFALQAAVGPFVGQNYGAAQLDRVRRAVRSSVNFLMIYGIAMAVVLFIIARPTAAFFDANPVVVNAASAYLSIVPFTYGTFGVMMIAVACFNSLGRPLPAAVLTFVKFFVVYLPLAWGLSRLLGLNGIFWANALSHLAFGVASFIWLKRFLRTLASRAPHGAQPSEAEEAALVGPIQ